MTNIHSPAPWASSRGLLSVAAAVGLCFGLQACVDGPQSPAPEPVNPNPDACAFLPVTPTSYKGGNTWGEELTVALDPDTLAYTITIDASLQRTVGAEFSGTLDPLNDGCTYASDEADAVFTLAAGGLLQGGVIAPDSDGFAPLLAFRNTFNNADNPAVFNPVSVTANVFGIQRDGADTTSWRSSGILRNAGTLQNCIGTAAYSASCTPRERGYITYVADRNAFDYYATDPAEPTPTTGGDLAGSVIIGLVSGNAVPLQLVRESQNSHGMRVYTPQTTVISGEANGSFSVIGSNGGAGDIGGARILGANFSRGQVSASLTYDSPVAGVIAVSGDIVGNLLVSSGLYLFIPEASTLAFELGVQADAGTLPAGPDDLEPLPDDPGNPPVDPEPEPSDPEVCALLPAEAVSYKGGNFWGEELTVALNPDTLAYTITIDASLQRTVGTALSGTLVPLDDCTYTSNEASAVFTLAAGGVIQGGVAAPDGDGFAPLLAFSDTFRTPEDDDRRFNDVSFSANGTVLGVQYDGATAQSWSSSGILRNAGTIQTCIGLVAHSASCTPRERGYVTYVADRNAFDYYATDPAVSTPTTGGDLAGSVIVGQVGVEVVVLQLVRTPSSHGLRIMVPAASTGDGSFSTLDADGNANRVTTAGNELSRGDATAMLSVDTPSPGFTEASGGVSGHFIMRAGIYAFVSSEDGPTFELGVQN